LNLNAQKKSIDYFRHQEMSELYQAALDFGSMKSYHSSSMTVEERDRLKMLLAQRLEMPKDQIGPDEFARANSWKFPALIATTIDVGLRPIEVKRSTLEWIDLKDDQLVIPAEESTKNEEPWECVISPRTQRTLKRWLEERKQYEKYDGSASIWLTKYGNPYESKSLNTLLNNLLERTEIQPNGRDLSWYAIRRGCATMWANKGDVHDAKEQLRHSELKTTMRYVHSSSNRRKGLAETLW
jgi:integrase